MNEINLENQLDEHLINLKSKEDYLIPLKEDLADWIVRIFDDLNDLNADNFITKLDNGVIICKLAKHIEESCQPQFAQLTAAGQSTNLNFTELLKLRQNISNQFNKSNVSTFLSKFFKLKF